MTVDDVLHDGFLILFAKMLFFYCNIHLLFIFTVILTVNISNYVNVNKL